MNDKDLEWEEISVEHIIQDEWIDFRRSTYCYPDGSVFSPYYSYSRRDFTIIIASDEEGNYLCVRQFRQGIKQVTTEFPAGGIERYDGKEYGEHRNVEDVVDSTKESLWQNDKMSRNAEDVLDTAKGSLKQNDKMSKNAEDVLDTAKGSLKQNVEMSRNAEDALDAAKRELREETGYVSDDWTHLITIPSNPTISDNYAYVFMAENCRKAGDQHLDETEYLNVEKYMPEQIEELIHTGKFQQPDHVMGWLLAKEIKKTKK